MKKMIALLLLVAALCALLCGCGPEEWECELCHKMTTGEKYSMPWFGRTLYFCEECNENNKEFFEFFE